MMTYTMTERGRYCSLELRSLLRRELICKMCDSYEVEDEFRFIMNCKMYSEHRDVLMIELGKLVNINK